MFEDRLAVATKIKSKCMEATWPSCSFLCMMLQIWQVFSDINGILPVSEFCVRFWFLQKDKAFMTKTDPVSSPCKNHGSNANRSPNQIRFLTWPFHNSAPPRLHSKCLASSKLKWIPEATCREISSGESCWANRQPSTAPAWKMYGGRAQPRWNKDHTGSAPKI